MQLPSQHFRIIGPDYFETIHLPVVAGRTLGVDDRGKRVALISELTAKTMWPHGDSIGQTFTRGGEKDLITVIGVVKDARTITLAQADPMMVYIPYWYRALNNSSLVVSTKQDPSQMADEIRRAVW
ncbi:MAG TPA: ABC transporter permease, partial [Edaphobacter sp.]